MAKNKIKIWPIALITAAIGIFYYKVNQISAGITVGITKVRSVSFSNFPDLLIKYDLELINFTNFDVPFSGIQGFVYFGNSQVGQVTYQGQFAIPANGKKVLTINIQASLLSLGYDIYSRLKDGTGLRGNLTFQGNIFTQGLIIPFNRVLI